MTALVKKEINGFKKPQTPRPNPKDKKNKPPATRKRFSDEWDEALYNYTKLLHWLYGEQNEKRGKPFATRIIEIFEKISVEDLEVIGCEALSLAHECFGDLNEAIFYRELEIARIEKHVKTKNIYYDYCDLGDRYDLLSILYMQYDEPKDIDKAISLLHKSKKLANKHGHEFDGQDILDDALKLRKLIKSL